MNDKSENAEKRLEDAVFYLKCSMWVGLLSICYVYLHIINLVPVSRILVVALVVGLIFALVWALIVQIGKARNWARIILSALFLLGVFYELVEKREFFSVWSYSWFLGILYVVQFALQLSGLLIIHRQPVAELFKSHRRRRAGIS